MVMVEVGVGIWIGMMLFYWGGELALGLGKETYHGSLFKWCEVMC